MFVAQGEHCPGVTWGTLLMGGFLSCSSAFSLSVQYSPPLAVFAIFPWLLSVHHYDLYSQFSFVVALVTIPICAKHITPVISSPL